MKIEWRFEVRTWCQIMLDIYTKRFDMTDQWAAECLVSCCLADEA